MHITTLRLLLIAATEQLTSAQVDGPAALGDKLGMRLAEDWPPQHNTPQVARFFHTRLAANPEHAGWWSWFVAMDREVVAIVGLKGRPTDGMVEAGYSVVDSRHREGIAFEAVTARIEWAWTHEEVTRVEAETLPHLAPSIGVLGKLGFQPMPATTPDTIRFVLHRP